MDEAKQQQAKEQQVTQQAAEQGAATCVVPDIHVSRTAGGTLSWSWEL